MQPVIWLQDLIGQTQMDWHLGPYDGKGHGLQTGWYP